VVGNEKAKSASKSATVEKATSGTTVEKSASKEIVAALKPAKSRTAPANPPTPPGAAKSDNKLEQQVGAKQQKVEKPTRSSKSAPVGSVWTRANPKFKFGEPFLS
jgi:hypothetical protein